MAIVAAMLNFLRFLAERIILEYFFGAKYIEAHARFIPCFVK